MSLRSGPRLQASRAAPRRRPDHGQPAVHAVRLAGDPAGARRRPGSDRPRCGRRRRCVRGHAPRDPRPRPDGHDRDRCGVRVARPGWRGLPDGREVACRRVGRGTPPVRRRQRLWRRSRDVHRSRAARARPVRGGRGDRDRGLRDRRERGVHRGPRGADRGHPAPRGGHRGRGGSRLSRHRRARLRPRHRRHASGRSRAPTCSARRPSC